MAKTAEYDDPAPVLDPVVEDPEKERYWEKMREEERRENTSLTSFRIRIRKRMKKKRNKYATTSTSTGSNRKKAKKKRYKEAALSSASGTGPLASTSSSSRVSRKTKIKKKHLEKKVAKALDQICKDMTSKFSVDEDNRRNMMLPIGMPSPDVNGEREAEEDEELSEAAKLSRRAERRLCQGLERLTTSDGSRSAAKDDLPFRLVPPPEMQLEERRERKKVRKAARRELKARIKEEKGRMRATVKFLRRLAVGGGPPGEEEDEEVATSTTEQRENGAR